MALVSFVGVYDPLVIALVTATQEACRLQSSAGLRDRVEHAINATANSRLIEYRHHLSFTPFDPRTEQLAEALARAHATYTSEQARLRKAMGPDQAAIRALQVHPYREAREQLVRAVRAAVTASRG